LRRMIRYAKSIGLNVALTSIFGVPGETFQLAYETLEFLRTNKVPIQTQQMQLFFGSMYEKNHEKFGFKPIPGYLPAYQSVGLRYETQTLTRTDIRKLRNISYLAHEIVRQDVQNRENSFDVLDFLLHNEDDLCTEEAFYEYGAIVSSTLEEEELLWRFLDGLPRPQVELSWIGGSKPMTPRFPARIGNTANTEISCLGEASCRHLVKYISMAFAKDKKWRSSTMLPRYGHEFTRCLGR
jgi:hypothetical protein